MVGGSLRLDDTAFGIVAFFVARVVGVARLDGDFVAFVICRQGVGLAVSAGDFFALAQPLVADFAFVKVVGVMDFSRQGLTDLGVAADADVAFVVGLWRIDRRVVRVVLHVQGEGFVVGTAMTVVGRHLQRDGFLGRKVQMLSGLEFQGAVGADFKAAVADFVGVGIAGIGVGGGQFAYFRTVLAFHHLGCAQGDVGWRVVGTAGRVLTIGDGNGRLITGIARFVAEDVLHRSRIAGESGFGREGNLVKADAPGSLSLDANAAGRLVCGWINQTDAVVVDIGNSVWIAVIF